MRKKLEKGITLVVDRYAFSGVAFTSAKVESAAHSPLLDNTTLQEHLPPLTLAPLHPRAWTWTGARVRTPGSLSQTCLCTFIPPSR